MLMSSDANRGVIASRRTDPIRTNVWEALRLKKYKLNESKRRLESYVFELHRISLINLFVDIIFDLKFIVIFMKLLIDFFLIFRCISFSTCFETSKYHVNISLLKVSICIHRIYQRIVTFERNLHSFTTTELMIRK